MFLSLPCASLPSQIHGLYETNWYSKFHQLTIEAGVGLLFSCLVFSLSFFPFLSVHCEHFKYYSSTACHSHSLVLEYISVDKFFFPIFLVLIFFGDVLVVCIYLQVTQVLLYMPWISFRVSHLINICLLFTVSCFFLHLYLKNLNFVCPNSLLTVLQVCAVGVVVI